MKIVADANLPYVEDFFAGYGQITRILGREISAKDVRDADILLVRAVTKVNAQLLEGSQVKFVGSMTAGADHLDTAWLDQRGIKWSTTPGFNAPPVADYIISVVAALMQRRLMPPKTFKAAVVGVGHIGKLVSAKLKLLGADVIECDPVRAKAENNFVSVPFAEITDVDLVTFHVPLTSDGEYPTRHMVDKQFLTHQKSGCVLINASRGAVIDSEALKQHGAHLLWCLDVFEHEPDVENTLLEKAALSTPHIAGYSVQGKVRGMKMLYQAVCDAGFVDAKSVDPVPMPSQTLQFSGSNHRWQDIVLGVFNPAVMTAMMRTTLLPVANHGALFDAMRHRFQFRHEFAYTRIPGLVVSNQDVRILAHLGFDLNS